jgi:hypothetical protein
MLGDRGGGVLPGKGAPSLAVDERYFGEALRRPLSRASYTRRAGKIRHEASEPSYAGRRYLPIAQRHCAPGVLNGRVELPFFVFRHQLAVLRPLVRREELRQPQLAQNGAAENPTRRQRLNGQPDQLPATTDECRPSLNFPRTALAVSPVDLVRAPL